MRNYRSNISLGSLGRLLLAAIMLITLTANVAAAPSSATAANAQQIKAQPLSVAPKVNTTAVHSQAAFGSGNLVIERVGDGSAALSSAATAVFLDEYSTAGSPVQTIPLPTITATVGSSTNYPLTNSGTATSEGALELSANGQYLTMAGYDALIGTAKIASSTTVTAARAIGLIDYSGNITTSTLITDSYSGNNIRGAVTKDGTGFWTAGASDGIHYVTLGSTGTSTAVSANPTNSRVLAIFNGQLYVTAAASGNFGIYSVGTGLPTTSGQTATQLTGFSTSTSPYAFVFSDTNTVYVADSGKGIQKWVNNAGTWAVSYTFTSTQLSGVTGLTGKAANGAFTLYATTPTTLFSITDTGAASTINTLATAGTNEAFRGVAFAPSSPIPSSITGQSGNQTIFTGQSTVLTVTAIGTGLTYQWYQGNAGDTSKPVAGANSNSFTTPVLTTTTSYWVQVTDSSSQTANSNTITITVLPDPYITTQPANQNIFAGGTATLSVVATGTTTLNYQWYQGNSGDTSIPVGTNSPSFTTPVLTTTTNYWVAVSDTNGTANSNTATVSVITQVRIHDIQGNKFVSSLITSTVKDNGITYGPTVSSVPGIVTAVGDSGFYFQDPNPDSDPATSEGIYVYIGSAPAITVGDSILVTGTVEEYRQGCTNSSCTSSSSAWANIVTTELGSNNSKVTLVSHGNAVPAPIIVGQGGRVPPNTNIVSPVISGNVEALITYTLQPSLYGLDYWRSLEGMRVQVNNAVAVEPTRLYGSNLPASCETANNNCEIAVVPDNGAEDLLTSPYGGVVSTASNYNPQRIILNNVLNPSHPSFVPEVNVGAKFSQPITGVIDYNFENFKLVPTQDLPSTTGGATRDVLSAALSNPNSSQLNIATFNVENLAPSDPITKYNGLASIVVNNLKSPDIIAVEEIQDNDGATDDGVVAADQTYAALINAISNAGGPTYVYQQIDPVNDQDGGQPGGNIRQGFLFRTDRGLSFVNAPSGAGGSTTAEVVQNVNGKPQLQYNPGRIDPTDSAAWASSRKPLAGEFSFNGRTLFVIANHFVAKLGDQPLFGRFQPPAQVSVAQRVEQANDVASFVQQILAIDPNAAVAVVGDLNDYQYSQALQILDNAGLHDLITTLPLNQQFTYDFEGNSQVLDHILVSNGLYQGSANQYQSVHVNSLFFDQSSDHDPSVAQLNLPTAPQANDDNYTVTENTIYSTTAATGILANDTGANPVVISHSNTTNGTLSVNADGSFVYTPTVGFLGTDVFTYTIDNAVQVYKTNLPTVPTSGGVNITAGGYGSSLYPDPNSANHDEYYGVTDRGPNVDGPNGTKVEPIPNFNPAIGKFKFVNGQAILEQNIPLSGPNGEPYSGRVNSQNGTGETITDLNGNVLATDPFGYDSEGLVALPDGTFWVSDEYGPFVTHFDATGKQIARLSPFDNSLPAELQLRVPNRGLEGLTITPDGTTLVAMMQSALQQPDLNGSNAKNVTILRITTYNLSTQALHEYLYLLDNPKTNSTAVSEITALSNTTFLVDERDGNFPPNTYKKLFKIDITNATDVGPSSTVANSTYSNACGTPAAPTTCGLLVNGKSLELLVKSQDTTTSQNTLQNLGITPVTKTLYLDVTNVLTTLDPNGGIFDHDKIEGVASVNGNTTLVLSNDSDFGIDGVTNTTPPFQLHAKIDPTTGAQDDGEFLLINLNELPAITSTATVTFNVITTTTTTTPTPTATTPTPTTTTPTPTSTTPTPTPTTPAPGGNTYSYFLPFLSNNGAGANIVNTNVLPRTSTYNTYVSIENSSSSAAVFTITYYSAQGSVIGTDNNGGNALAPNNRYLPTSPLASGQNASAIVTSNQPLNIVVSESGTVNGKATASSYTAINTSTDAASTIYAPIALNNSYGGYTTNFVLANLGSVSTTATIQYYSDNGQPATSQSIALASHAQTNVLQSSTGANLPSNFSGWAIISSSGSQPLAGQVIETNPNFSFLETVDMPGVSGKTLYIPTVFQQAFGNFNTGMQLVNPNGTTANVTVTYYRKDGTKITAGTGHGSFSIGANSDKSFYHDTTDFPELNTPNGGFVGTAVVTSDQPLIAIVNQAGSLGGIQYNGAFGTVLNGAAKVSVPVAVKNSYGYTTGLQVSNISNVASTATLTYYDTKGTKIYSYTLKSDAGGAIPAYGSVNPYLGIESNLPSGFDGIAVVTADTTGAQFIVIANNASSQFFYTFANNS